MAHRHVSSLLSAVDEAIKICQVDEVRITEAIHQSKNILLSMKVKNTKEIEEEEEDPNFKNDIQPEERQEIELLERVLEKALKVRSSSCVLKQHDTANKVIKEKCGGSDHSLESNCKEMKPVTNHTVQGSVKRKLQKNASQALSNEVHRKSHHGTKAKSCMVQASVQRCSEVSRKGLSVHRCVKGQSRPPPHSGKTLDCHQRGQNAEESHRAGATSQSAPKEPASVSLQEGTDMRQISPPKEQWIPSPLLPSWRTQRAKRNKLWNKVIAMQSKPVPERTKFTERLRCTFPTEWPTGSPADNQAELESLTHLCQDLCQCCHAALLAPKACAQGREPGTVAEKECEANPVLDTLEKKIIEVSRRASLMKTEAEVWAGWRCGGVCPGRRRGRWGEADGPCLPLLLSFSSQSELTDLQRLRLRVEQLQQELHLHQAMSNGLSPCLTSTLSPAPRPCASLLRGLYSLLGEGGAQFPSLLLDTEPD